MVLYPPSLVYLILPLGWSLGFFCLLHLWFAGLGMYVLAARWTQNRLGAALAGLGFSFSGLSIAFLMWPSHIATLSWMPWVLWITERAWRRGGVHIVWAGLMGAMQMLAGGPETILFTWLLTAAVVLLSVLLSPSAGCTDSNDARATSSRVGATTPESSSRSQIVFRFCSVVLLVACLAAVQLLPSLDLIAHSQRTAGHGDSHWSMPVRGWANFLVPMAFGHPWFEGIFFQHGQGWISSFYVGIATLLLAVMALHRSPSPRRKSWSIVRLLCGVIMICYLCALGDQTPIFPSLRRFFPVFGFMRYPIKFVIPIIFALPLLAAFGLDGLAPNDLQAPKAVKKRVLMYGGGTVLLIGLILLWAWRSPMPLDDLPATSLNGVQRIFFLSTSVLILCLLPGLASIGAQRAFAIALLVIIWIDLRTHEPPQNSFLPPAVYEPGIVRNTLAVQPEPRLGGPRVMVSPDARESFYFFAGKDIHQGVVARRLGYYSDCNLLDSAPKLDGFFSLYPRHIGDLVSFLYASSNSTPSNLMDFLGVSQVTAPGAFTEWRSRSTALPLVTAGQKPVFVEDTNTLNHLLAPGFDPLKTAFLPVGTESLVTVRTQTEASVSLRRFSDHRIEFTVRAGSPGLVVVAQTFYHPWHVFLDGEPRRLFRANLAFQAFEVPAGTHHAVLAYQDRAFEIGGLISVSSLLLCAIVIARFRTRSNQGLLTKSALVQMSRVSKTT